MDATIAKAGVSAWVYDPTRDLIYIVNANGSLRSWSFAEQAFRSTVEIGRPITSIDITPDGHFLFLGEREPTLAGDGSATDAIDRVDLATMDVTRLTFPVSNQAGGIAHLAVAADNHVLVSTYSGPNSGVYELWTFVADAATPNFQLVPGLTPFSSASFLIPSEDRRYVFIAEANASGGPMDVYDASQGRVTDISFIGRVVGRSGFQLGVGDITSAGGRIVDVADQNFLILDTHFNLVQDLSPLFGHDLIIGAEFNEGGKQLFVWDATLRKIIVLDVQTWQQLASFDQPSAHDVPPDFQQWGQMDVVSGGRFLVVDDQTSLKVIDLTTSLHISLPGTGGNDVLNGAIGSDTLMGINGDDTISGSGGADSIDGGAGQNYLRGDEGADVIRGGSGFDDANGNMGNDTVATGAGDDYAVGGKDNDSLSGEAGGDVVWGNLGNDTQDGGDGNDQVRGGQGDDSVAGGAGSDFVSGDRGNDTISGGAGADLFHGSQDAGIDRVIDFNLAEGDRVMLDPGTTYTLSQVGGDTVLDMGGGNQMILVGVPMSALSASSIFIG